MAEVSQQRVKSTTWEGANKILHLACGHEVKIPGMAAAPNKVECRYCSRVKTLEESESED